jgi:hypothetical protein
MESELLAAIRAQIPGLPVVDPAQLAPKYNPLADTLVVYLTPDHKGTVWSELDDYLLLGREEQSGAVTGIMIEYFSEWLLLAASHAYQGKSAG